MTDPIQEAPLDFATAGTLAISDFVLRDSPAHSWHAQVIRLYEAVLDRVPDMEGLLYYVKLLDSGVSLNAVADRFVHSAEFEMLYGTDPSNEAMINALYMNALERQPDVPGFAYWMNQLESGTLDLAGVIVGISESPENTDIIITYGSGSADHAFY